MSGGKKPPTPEQILAQQMYDKFKELHPTLSHNPSSHEPYPVWGFDKNEEAENFVRFFRDVWQLDADRIAITNENVGLSLEGVAVGSKLQAIVRLNTNLPYVEGNVDAWARENGISVGRSCAGMRLF